MTELLATSHASQGGSEPYFRGLFFFIDGLYDKAAEQFMLAAEKGDQFAYYRLGMMHRDGKGFAKSIDEAMMWFRLGAECRNPDCCYSYAVALFDTGHECDVPGQVLDLAMNAVMGGNLLAMWLLGNIYRDGTGVDSSPEDAKRWYEEAVNHGVAGASKDLKDLRTNNPELFGDERTRKGSRKASQSSQERMRRSEKLGELARDTIIADYRRFMEPAEALSCSVCSSPKVSRYGSDSFGRQKYRCSHCNHIFVPSDDNLFKGSKLSYDVWMNFASCYAYGMSMRETARGCGVCQKTASLMKKRLEASMGINDIGSGRD